jgi:hypothetical protein
MVKIVKYQEVSRESILTFCKLANSQIDDAAINMWAEDWNTAPNTLPYLLFNTDRFQENLGEFNFLISDNNLVACAGVYLSEFDKRISIAGSRTWVDPKFRNLNLVRDYLLTAHKSWSINHHCKQIAVCFNNYNKNLARVFYRNRLGEKNSRLFSRTPEHLFYSNINELPFSVTIQHTEQWVLYEKLDPNWDFDWTTIKHVYCT